MSILVQHIFQGMSDREICTSRPNSLSVSDKMVKMLTVVLEEARAAALVRCMLIDSEIAINKSVFSISPSMKPVTCIWCSAGCHRLGINR